MTRQENIIELLKSGDKGTPELVTLTGISFTSLNVTLTQMVEDEEIYLYRLNTPSHAKRFTLDKSKHTETGRVHKDVIPGARVYMLEDKSRQEINREIMRSNYRKAGKVYPGSSWEATLAMPS